MKTKDLQSGWVVGLMVLNLMAPVAGAQSQQSSSSLPNAPAAGTVATPPPQPALTEPYSLRPTDQDFSQGKSQFPNPFSIYTPQIVPPPRLTNTSLLDSLYRDGKIYLSLDDAILLALQNNFDVAIARYNLDIADTDLLRAHAGLPYLGVNTGLVTGTMGGSTSPVASASPAATTGATSPTSASSSTTTTTIQSTGAAGGGPGGTSAGAGGAGSGPNGITSSTMGAGPLDVPLEPLDPVVSGTVQLSRAYLPESSKFLTGTFQLNENTNEYNFNYSQGFLPGETLAVTFNNSRTTTDANSAFGSFYSPALTTSFNAQLTQHLLQGFGWDVNGRYIEITKNNRRITDVAFRAQLLYTIDQIENIYWGLVGAYQDEKTKTGALKQSTQLLSDDRKQLQIGTVAPLEVVNARAQVASDRQALTSSRSKLEYQQLIMKQAIARNLDDPIFAAAPIVPTDRVSLARTPEEDKSVEQLVQEAYANSPGVEEAILNLKNQQITLKSVKNALLPVLDVYGFYGAEAIGGAKNPLINCTPFAGFDPCSDTPGLNIPYTTVLGHLADSSGSNKGVGFNFTVPIRNRQAQAQAERAQIEYRQSQMRLQQLYVQLKMQVTNQLYALQNDRAQVQSAEASQQYAVQSLDAEQKKYRLGASTTANVLSQTRNYENAQDNLIAAQTTYAVDRAALSQLVADTLQKYGIDITDAATGNISQEPAVPGLEAPQPEQQPEPLHPNQTPNGNNGAVAPQGL